MKKIILVLLCVVFLTGCHGNVKRNEFEIPDGLDKTKNYQITFWAKNDTNLNQVEIYHNAIADFEKLYPNINVNIRLYTDYGKIYNDVITNIPTATTPNVCITYPDHIATYLTGENAVVPLDGLINHEKYGLGAEGVKFDAPKKDEIIPQFMKECSFDGSCYALPFMRSTEACYVNKTFVEKLGYTLPEVLTWDFVWEVSETATKKDANGNYTVNGQKVMIPFIYKSTDNMIIQLLRQKNAGYSDKNGNILIFNDVTKNILSDIASHTKNGAFSTFKISGYPANFLNAGQCIFAVDSTAGATWMGSDAPLIDINEKNLVEFETKVMTIPQINPKNPTMISQGPSVCIFNKENAEEVLASWLFVQYLLTNDVQIAYSCTEGYVPVTSKAQSSTEYTDYLSRSGEDIEHYYSIKLDAAKLLLSNTQNTFTAPVFNGSASLRNAAGQMIESVTKSTRRKETVDDSYLDKLFSDVKSLYRLEKDISHSKNLGPLPTEAVFLIFALCSAWILIGTSFILGQIRKK